MWLITNFGFFSVVEKPAQKGSGMLTVRARVKADLEALRDKYLPAMGSIEGDKGTDYKWRAVAPAAQVAAAFCKAVADVDYSNFKNSVQARQGTHRHDVYSELWTALWKLADEDKATPTARQSAKSKGINPARPKPPERPASDSSVPSGASCGGVVMDQQGRVLLRKPAGGYGGLAWTFPKGKPDPGESPTDTAVREVREETGYEVQCGSRIPGVFQGAVGGNVYFLMEPVKDHHDFDKAETEAVAWAVPEEARTLLSESSNPTSRKRDLDVLEAALALLNASTGNE